MKLLGKIMRMQTRSIKRKSLAEYQREVLVRQGREQFQQLADRGLSIRLA